MASMRTPHNDPLRGLPLDALRGFEAAARHLSFTHAAAELHVTQSAVSREVKAIEDRLGARLFERTPKRLILTDHGHQLLKGVAQALELIRRTMDSVSDAKRKRTLTVMVSSAMAHNWFLPNVNAFLASHPDIE